MSQVVIEGPILNSPFEEPRRHFQFTEEGITNEVAEQRRPSCYFIPIARPRKQTRQLTFDYVEERRENDHINYVRSRVGLWRQRGYPGVTPVTRALLDQWRCPDRDADGLTDEDLMRDVLNTVGKPGKLGENVRCVVSVSMLTEGWDVNTVTHILGVRAFGTQLLCEQVIGRGLRRRSYTVNAEGDFDRAFAEVQGVPFEEGQRRREEAVSANVVRYPDRKSSPEGIDTPPVHPVVFNAVTPPDDRLR